MREKDPNELGALWVKSGVKGEYMTGEVSGVRVVCFRNTSTSEKAPQWRVLKSTPKGEARPSQVEPLNDSDVPF